MGLLTGIMQRIWDTFHTNVPIAKAYPMYVGLLPTLLHYTVAYFQFASAWLTSYVDFIGSDQIQHLNIGGRASAPLHG